MRCELEIFLAKNVKHENVNLLYSKKSDVALSIFCNWYNLRVRVIEYDGKERVMDYSTKDLGIYFRSGVFPANDSSNFQFGAGLQKDILTMRVRITQLNPDEQPGMIYRAQEYYGRNSHYFTEPMRMHATYLVPHITKRFCHDRGAYKHINAMVMDMAHSHRHTREGPDDIIDTIKYFTRLQQAQRDMPVQRMKRGRTTAFNTFPKQRIETHADTKLLGEQFQRLKIREVDAVASEILRYQLISKMTPIEFECVKQYLRGDFIKGAGADTLALAQLIKDRISLNEVVEKGLGLVQAWRRPVKVRAWHDVDPSQPKREKTPHTLPVSIPLALLPAKTEVVEAPLPELLELQEALADSQEFAFDINDLAPSLDLDDVMDKVLLEDFADSLAAGPTSNSDAPRGEYDLADML